MTICCLLVMIGGCAPPPPNLVTYPPPEISPSLIKGLEELSELSSAIPDKEYALAVKNMIEQSKATISFYQEKLFPVFGEMHQKNQKKDYVGMSILLAKAKAYNEEWLQFCLTLRQTYEKLDEVNNKTTDDFVKERGAELIESGKKLAEKIISTTNTIREFLDITEGYDRARIKRDSKFLTKENEQRFNTLSQTLNQASQELNREGENLLKESIEFNELWK